MKKIFFIIALLTIFIVNIHAQSCTPPSKPTGLTATAVSSSQINLKWNAVTGAIGYDLSYCDGTYIGFVSGTTYSHTGRVASTTYSYKVQAQKSATCVSGFTTCVSATTQSSCTPPSKPTGLSATAVSSSQINLSWSAVSGAIGYDVYYCDGTYIGFVSSTSYSHTGRAASTNYSYKIQAQKSATCLSGFTTCVSATTQSSCTPPSKPSGLSATAVSSSQINLSWSSVSGAIGYDVYYCDGTYIGYVTGTSYNHTGRAENTNYSYKIQAQKSATCVSGFTTCFSATTPSSCTPPSKPTGLTATAVSSSQINLSWNAVSGAIGYDVSYCDGTYIGYVTGTSYSHTGRAENTNYSYRVQAQKSESCVSGFTSCVSATTPSSCTPPSKPTGLTATAVSSSQINLSWNAVSGAIGYDVSYCDGTYIGYVTGTSYNHTGRVENTNYSYKIQAQKSATCVSGFTTCFSATTPSSCTPPSKPTGLTANAVSSSQINLSWNAVSGAIGYDVSYCDGTYIGYVTGTSYSHTGRVENTNYSYKIQAQKSESCVSGYTSCFSATTPSSCTPPSIPTGLTATAVSTSQINLSWNAVSGAIGYDVSYCDGTYIEYVTGTSYNHTGRVENTNYSYKIQAQKSATCVSGFTTCFSATTPSSCTPPTIPAGLTATAVSSSQIDLSWNAVSGAIGYDVSYCDGTYIGYVTGTSYSHTGRVENTNYSYKIQAQKSATCISGFTTCVSATTQIGLGTPTLLSPANGTSFNVGSTLSLSWSTVANATSYDVEFDNGTTFSYTYNSPTNSYSAIVEASSVGSHTWRVRAKNPTGSGTWTTTPRSFTVVSGIPTVAPTLIAPADDATVIANVSTRFSWNTVTGAMGYDLQFNNESIIDRGSSTSFDLLTSSLGSGTWKVRAKNTAGAGPWSSPRSFTTVSGNIVNLQIQTLNIDNTFIPFPGVNGKVLLYDLNKKYLNKFEKTSTSGVSTFSNLAYGNYFIEAYHLPIATQSIFGEEFWGGINISYSSTNTKGTIIRDMPYSENIRIINVATGQDVTGGSVSAGTQLRFDVKVKNPGNSPKQVKVRLVFDRDQISGFDWDKLSIESIVPAKSGQTAGEVTISFPFDMPSLVGDFFGAIGTMTNTNGSDYAYTDGTSWSKTKWLTVTNLAPTGKLNIVVKNVPSGKSTLPGANGTVELFNKANSSVGSKKTDVNGAVSFTGLPAESGYYYKVKHNAITNFTDFKEEYWGTQRDITIISNQTISSNFVRNQPFGDGIRIFNGTTDVTGQTVEPNSNLTIKYTIINPGSSPINARGIVVIDESKTYSWDYEPFKANLELIPANGKITQSIPFTPKRGGNFFASGMVNIESLTTNGGTIYTDNTVWGDNPIIRIAIPKNSVNLLDAFVNMANNRKDENGNFIKQIDELYKENKKVFYFSEGEFTFPTLPPITLGVNVFIDLVDIYSYTMFKNGILDKAVSAEGNDGWITVWINGKVGSAIGYGANTGITAPVTITNNEWDPTMKLEFKGLELKAPFYNISAVESDGVNWGEIKKINTVDSKVSAFELGFNISRFEINIDRINEIFNSSYKSSLSDGILTSNSTNSFFSRIIDLDNLKIVPNKTLKEYDESKKRVFRPFSSNDNNKVGVNGVINFLIGGVDKNNDRIKDNVYPVIPNVYGLTHFENQAELTFQNTSEDETADFYIKVVNVPYGWIIDSQDKKEYTLFPEKQDYTFDSFGALKSLWNTFHSTKWTIGCIDANNAPDDAELTFELWHNKNGFDKLLQTKKLTVHKQKADGNISPTISGLKAIVKSENPTKNIEISWIDSDPDDDATIAIAIDFDKLSDKPWVSSGIHRWISTGINESSNINTFNWDITGIPTGTYSMWAVIYDGKNEPKYVKSDSEISISTLFDSEKPYVKITNNKLWINENVFQKINFYDNIGLDNIFYQVIPKRTIKSAEINGYSGSTALTTVLANDLNWEYLTSNGVSILPGSQFNLIDSLTSEWKINNSDWEKMVSNSQKGQSYYIYLKATDDAGNTFLTLNETEALEIKIDVDKPNLIINYPADGQRINSNNVNIIWSADDIVDGVELSGLDSFYVAIDQTEEFTKLEGNLTSYILTNLSDGLHKVYLKAKDNAGNYSDLQQANFSVNSDIQIASVELTEFSGLTMTELLVKGVITDDKGVAVLSKGVCWSTEPNPTIVLSTKTNEGSGNRIFSSFIKDLAPGITYFIRPYATNCAGTAYGQEIVFTTPNEIFSNIDISKSSIKDFLIVFPNPNKGEFTIQLDTKAGESIVIEVYNQFGQRIFWRQDMSYANTFSRTISLKEIVSGIYFIRAKTKSNICSEKIIIME